MLFVIVAEGKVTLSNALQFWNIRPQLEIVPSAQVLSPISTVFKVAFAEVLVVPHLLFNAFCEFKTCAFVHCP